LTTISSAFDKANYSRNLAPLISHTMLNAYSANEVNVVISNRAYLEYACEVSVFYSGRRRPWLPIIGPGAQVQVTYGTNGGITACTTPRAATRRGKWWPSFSPGLAGERVAHLFLG